MSSGLVWKFTLVYWDTLEIHLPQGAVVQDTTHPVRHETKCQISSECQPL